jgi:predicted ribosome quality control (RQC) complex YloA/Tae2 family protein
VDVKKTFSWNLENCFRRAKENEKKIAGTERRRSEVAARLAKVEAGELSTPANSSPHFLADAKVKGRTFDLGEGLTLFIGKSAADNMRLLREAKAWHYWLHLRDQPSCHGLLHRNKGQKISDAAFHQAAHHLIEIHFGNHHGRYDGEKFQIVVAECRFVKPIKGDRLGRVTYSNDRTLAHKYQVAKKS